MKNLLCRASVVASAVTAVAGGAAAADVVIEWQSTYQDIIRATGGAPCPVSRAGPMMSLAVFDAINGIDAANNRFSAYEPYLPDLPTPAADSSREAAAAEAAYRTLAPLHAGNAHALQLINHRYEAQMAAVPDGAAKTHGIEFGAAVAEALMVLRATDGFDADPTYTLGGNPGDWRPTPDGPDVPGFSPHWGNVTPWGLISGSQFRPTRLMDYGPLSNFLASAEYADNINGSANVLGVKDWGARDSTLRTAEETEIAWFWANDRDGTSKPPGQLVELSKVIAADRATTMSQNARMFALVNMAMGDACIAAWDCKYSTPCDLWRPTDAVRETQDDGNALTIPDPAWLPLNDFQPPFPAYISGHGTMGAAHAGIMAALFGDSTTFTLGSDEFAVNPGLGYDPHQTRTFDSFSQAAWENAVSRIYLGVHYYIDALDANTVGYEVAEYIFRNYLGPVCAADYNEDGGIDGSDVGAFFTDWESGRADADVNADGGIDGGDVESFFAAWENGGCI